MKRLSYLIITLLVFSCSNSGSNDDKSEQEKNAPELIKFNDYNVNLAKSAPPEVAFYSVWAGYGENLEGIFTTIPKLGKKSGSTWTHTYTTDEGVTETATITEKSNGDTEWKVVYNGTDSEEGITYNNFTAIKGISKSEGKEGSFEIYKENTTDVEFKYEWKLVGDELNTTFLIYNDVTNLKITFTSKKDGSGSLKTYESETLVLEASWGANGENGTWKNHKENTSGTW